jgi:hypothetical protein
VCENISLVFNCEIKTSDVRRNTLIVGQEERSGLAWMKVVDFELKGIRREFYKVLCSLYFEAEYDVKGTIKTFEKEKIEGRYFR